MLHYMFFTSDAEPGVQLPVLVIYDVSTGAVAGAQTQKEASTATTNTIVQCIETWGHSEIVLQADGEPSTRALVRAVASVRQHKTLPRPGPACSHQSQ
jgi:hypothetical protein